MEQQGSSLKNLPTEAMLKMELQVLSTDLGGDFGFRSV
jgi:hypothetical protein